MKIIKVTEHSLAEGTNQETIIPLDNRPGIYFRIVCGTYETPFFTKEQKDVPVLMVHGDREQSNISVTCDGENVIVRQTYRQSPFLYLFLCANNDWADTSELRPVSLDSTKIIKAKLSGGIEVDISTALNGTDVRLTTNHYMPVSSSLAFQNIVTEDGKSYIYTFTMASHVQSTDPIRYDFANTTVPRVITAFEKQE